MFQHQAIPALVWGLLIILAAYRSIRLDLARRKQHIARRARSKESVGADGQGEGLTKLPYRPRNLKSDSVYGPPHLPLLGGAVVVDSLGVSPLAGHAPRPRVPIAHIPRIGQDPLRRWDQMWEQLHRRQLQPPTTCGNGKTAVSCRGVELNDLLSTMHIDQLIKRHFSCI